jgi:hypothetical protein
MQKVAGLRKGVVLKALPCGFDQSASLINLGCEAFRVCAMIVFSCSVARNSARLLG